MKLWVDDCRPAHEGYFWCRTVKAAKQIILHNEKGIKRYNCFLEEAKEIPSWQLDGILSIIGEYIIELIDIDRDIGGVVKDGSDYIKFLEWLEGTGRNYPIHIHSMNSMGTANMSAIIKRN